MEDQKLESEILGKKETSHKYFFRFVGVFVVILLVLVIFKVSNSNELNSVSATSIQPVTGNVVNQNDGNVQVIKLSVQGSQYILEPSTVKMGIPVRIEGDLSKMPGCSKSIVIQAFNIRKNLIASDNVVEFTPDKSGTFNIACSMNMYKGTFTVLDSNGSKASYVEPKQTSGGTCGGGSGGCGCGGG